MVEGSTQEWFLEIDGRRTGPFDTEQVIGLLQDGEIPEITQVFASTTTTEFLTARELADREQKAQHIPHVEDELSPPDAPDPDAPEIEPEPSRSFIPPPRPSEFHPSPDSARQPPTAKPELGLVDALLAAKERKNNNTRAMPPEVAVRRPNPFRLQNIPRKAWAILGTAAVLFVAVWGMTHFIKQRASIATSPAPADSKAALTVPLPASPFKNTGSEVVSTVPAAAAPPPPQGVGSVPAATPPTNPAAMMPPSLGGQHDADAEREREQNAEREKEREREIAANNDAASQGLPPAPPPLETPPGGMVPGMGPGGVPPPPPPLPDTPEKAGNPFPAAGMENPPPPAPPPIE